MSSLSPSGNDVDETLATGDSAGLRRAPRLLARGECVGRYVVLDRVGQGGMGIVYAAYDPELDRKIAVKVLAPGPAGNTDGTADRIRLVREAQAMAKLAHPHVVPVHDAGTHDGAVFIAMEFVEGGTLAARLRERPRWEELLPLFVQAGSGLAAAHAAGLVHRDFKPDNVLLGKDGAAKVSDFGLARAVNSSETAPEPELRPAQDVLSSEITRVGALLGTPAYMAPEQHLHQPTDARSDQFAFCVALYEGLYGTRPFRGRSLSELVYAVTTGAIEDAPAGSGVPTRLRKVVLRGLAVEPAQRWPDMDALLAALREGPTRRRGRWIGLAAAGLVAAGGIGTLALLEHREVERCRNEAGAARSIWSEEARTRVADGLRSTQMPYVEPSIARVDAIIEPWVARWGEAREAVCLAEARETDDALVPLQRACLDERLVHLDVTLELLGEADVAVAKNAVQMAASLPRLEPCDNGRWLRQRAAAMTAAASDPATQLEVTRLVALARAHRTERARAIAKEMLVTTQDDPFLRAEVLRAVAQIEERNVDPVASVQNYEEAYFTAGRHRNDRTAALSAIDLAMLVGVRIHDIDKGRMWARHATMMVERDPDPELRNELLYVVGAIESTADNHAAAVAAFLEMVAIANETYGPDHPETGFAHMALGNAYSEIEPEQAAPEYQLAREIWARTLGPEHPTTLMASFNLANLHGVEGRLEEALQLHREILATRERIFEPGHIELAESYSAVGDALAWRDDFEGALAEHRRSLAIHQAHYGRDSPRTWMEVDNVIADLFALERAAEVEPLVAARCATAEVTRADQPDTWVHCLTQRAELAQMRGRFDDALSMYAEAIPAAEMLWGADHIETRTIRFAWARTLLRAGEIERAREQLERTVSEWDRAGAQAHPQLRDVLGELGRARARVGDHAGARRAHERALALAEAHGGSQVELAELRRDLEASE